MAVFPSFKLTEKGEELLNRSIGEGKTLTFTKFELGDGNPPSDFRKQTGLVNKFYEFPILNTSIQKDQVLRIKGYFDNKSFSQDKQLKEIGVFVKIEGNETQYLYSYTNAGDTGDIIPSNSRGFYSRTLDVANYIGYATNITFNIEQLRDRYAFNTENEMKVASYLKAGDKVELWGNLVLGDKPTDEYIIQDSGEIELSNGLFAKKVSFKYIAQTIEEMQRLALKVGDVVEVLGYYTAGDGAGHKRVIADSDDGSGVQLDNDLWANIVHNGEVNVSWFGIIDNSDISNFKFGSDIKYNFSNLKVKILKPININEISNMTIIDGEFISYNNSNIILSNCNKIVIKNCKFDGSNCVGVYDIPIESNFDGLRLHLSDYCIIENNVFNNFKAMTGIYSNGNNNIFNNNKLYNCYSKGNTDNYGDGINTTGKNCYVKNNVIINDTNHSVSIGRCGIVVEFDGENTVVENNYISGYDRGIHVEQVKKVEMIGNKTELVNVCLMVWGCDDYITARNNYFSNKGIDKNNSKHNTFLLDPNFRIGCITFLDKNIGRVIIENNNVELYDSGSRTRAVWNEMSQNAIINNNNIIINGELEIVLGRDINVDSETTYNTFSGNIVKGGVITVWFSDGIDMCRNTFKETTLKPFKSSVDKKTVSFNYNKGNVTFDGNSYEGIFHEIGAEFIGNTLNATINGTWFFRESKNITTYGNVIIIDEKSSINNIETSYCYPNKNLKEYITNSYNVFVQNNVKLYIDKNGVANLLLLINTPYHINLMEQEGGTTKQDFYAYLDEKFAYDKQLEAEQQAKSEAYELLLQDNPNLTWEESEHQYGNTSMMNLSLVERLEEPQIPESVVKFMEKYL